MQPAEFHYKIPWRASGTYPGHHASQQKGGGLEFRGHVPLIDAPDPRRFDLRASLRDPFERVQVRTYRQTSAIPVYGVADLSASMRFVGAAAKMTVLAEFVASLGYSAYRTGDRFGFVGCSDGAARPWVLPATLNRAAGMELAGALASWRGHGRDSRGLLDAAAFLGARRTLLFLLSDFHFPLDLLEAVLASLAYHDVVPVMLWDRHEYARLPRFGIARVTDEETGASRLLLMRPRLRQRIEQSYAARYAALLEVFARYGRRLLSLRDGFDADAVTEYFFG